MSCCLESENVIYFQYEVIKNKYPDQLTKEQLQNSIRIFILVNHIKDNLFICKD